MAERPARRPSLPPSLAPLGLTRAQAAEFIGVGVTTFDEMVADGLMPAPRLARSCVRWDRRLLELAFAELPFRDEQKKDPSPRPSSGPSGWEDYQ